MWWTELIQFNWKSLCSWSHEVAWTRRFSFECAEGDSILESRSSSSSVETLNKFFSMKISSLQTSLLYDLLITTEAQKKHEPERNLIEHVPLDGYLCKSFCGSACFKLVGTGLDPRNVFININIWLSLDIFVFHKHQK